MNNRKALLKRLQVCDFVLTEVALFLDTHPTDQDALACYQKYLILKRETLTEYTRDLARLTEMSCIAVTGGTG